MGKSKEEQIFIGDKNGNPVEITGAEKDAFIEQRNKDVAELEQLKAEQEARKVARLSALQKLGLTDEEIAAIL